MTSLGLKKSAAKWRNRRHSIYAGLLVASLIISTPQNFAGAKECRKIYYALAALAAATAGTISYTVYLAHQTDQLLEETRQVEEEAQQAINKHLAGDPSELVLKGFAKTVNRDEKEYPHIGAGIYLDIDKIESILKSHERELLRSPKENAEAIATVFLGYLFGEESGWQADRSDPSTYRPASSFFRGQSTGRGKCSEKSIVLVGIMKHYGVEARLVSGIKGEGLIPNHVFVHLPSIQRSADPVVSNILFPDRRHYLQEDGHIRTAWSKNEKGDYDPEIENDWLLQALLSVTPQTLAYNTGTDAQEKEFVTLKTTRRTTTYYGEEAVRFKAVLNALGVERDPTLVPNQVR